MSSDLCGFVAPGAFGGHTRRFLAMCAARVIAQIASSAMNAPPTRAMNVQKLRARIIRHSSKTWRVRSLVSWIIRRQSRSACSCM